MFERFTEKAIKSIMLAQEEARRLGHNFVGTEQMLLGLLGEGTGIAALAMKDAGMTLQAARVYVEQVIGRGSGFVAVEIPWTPRMKAVLEKSWEASRNTVGGGYIGTEHILMGLLDTEEGVAGRVFEMFKVDKVTLMGTILRLLQAQQENARRQVEEANAKREAAQQVSAVVPEQPRSGQTIAEAAAQTLADINGSNTLVFGDIELGDDYDEAPILTLREASNMLAMGKQVVGDACDLLVEDALQDNMSTLHTRDEGLVIVIPDNGHYPIEELRKAILGLCKAFDNRE